MGKLGKPSLVQWTSTNSIEKGQETKVIRKNTIMYGIALVLIVGMLFVMGGKKEYMLLNINKTTQLYVIDEEKGKVSNNFLFLFQNTEPNMHQYNLEVIGEYAGKIQIDRFEPFDLSPKKLAKKVVILSTTEKLVDDNTKDTPITVQIRAYSTTEPERVSVIREAVFIYPRADKLK
jgi:polyferredoxin